MKTVVLTIVLVFAVAVSVFADDKEDLLNEYKQIQNKLAQGRKAIIQLEARLIEIGGIIKYLDKKEAEEKKPLEEVIEEIEKEEKKDDDPGDNL